MDDPRRLTEVFIELADTLIDEFDVVDFMTLLTDRCVEVLGAAQAGVLLADAGNTLRSVASSNEAARLLDLFELQSEEGPCFDCFRTGLPIVNHSLVVRDQPWPSFVVEARRLGFRMVHALPMRLRGEVIGAMNIFGAGDDLLDSQTVAVAQALADIATIGLLQERSIREARRATAQLQGALTSRVVIEQAKGMLAEREGVSLDAAFRALRSYSQQENMRLAVVAGQLLDRTLDSTDIGRLAR